MNAPRKIPDAIRETQTRASDPGTSAFVAANAGAGKTHVLVQRVIRLLLRGTAPERILCITFTKAAAANMAQRVFETLGKWIALDDQRLDAALRDSGIARPDPATPADARKLFARALETPGGLKVQTIHALCTRLLQQFPFEANVPARFTVLDDRDQNAMMERASLAVLLDAAAKPDSDAGRALITAMGVAADVTFRDVVREACLSRDHFMTWIDRAGGAPATVRELSKSLNVDPEDRLETLDQSIIEGPLLPSSEWATAARTLQTGTANDRKQAERTRRPKSAIDIRCHPTCNVGDKKVRRVTMTAPFKYVPEPREVRSNSQVPTIRGQYHSFTLIPPMAAPLPGALPSTLSIASPASSLAPSLSGASAASCFFCCTVAGASMRSDTGLPNSRAIST